MSTMAYAKPIDIYQELQLSNAVFKKELNDGQSISDGDTVDLGNSKVIKDGILAAEDAEVSSDRSIKLYVGGSLVDTSDYELDLDKGELDYNGSSSGTAEATYFYTEANIPSRIVERRLDAATTYIDNVTNTTFNGTTTVTDEVYSGTGDERQRYIFERRPVRTVDRVEVNDAHITEPDNWTQATSGGGNDYVYIDSLGVEFIDGSLYPGERPYGLRVKYEYGYDNLPSDIKDLTIFYVISNSQKLQIMAANVKGRDNFDPETTNILDKNEKEIIDQYRVNRLSMGDYMVNHRGSRVSGSFTGGESDTVSRVDLPLNRQAYIEGDDIAWSFDFSQDITNWTVWFTMKENEQDSDADAVIQESVTNHDDPTNGITTITISSSQTADLTGNETKKEYWYDFQREDDKGNTKTLQKGKITFEEGITDA